MSLAAYLGCMCKGKEQAQVERERGEVLGAGSIDFLPFLLG